MSDSSITRVANKAVRNLLRGLLVKDISEKVAVATLDKLRARLDPKSTRVTTEILISNPLFSNLPLPDAFPRTATSADRFTRLAKQSLENELVFHCTRMAVEADKLSASLNALAALNQVLIGDEEAAIIEEIEKFRAIYGESLFILRKVAFAAVNAPAESKRLREYAEGVFSTYGATQRNIITLANVDVVDDSYDFIPLRRSMLDFVDQYRGRNMDTTIDIVEHVYRPFGVRQSRAQSVLHSYGLISLIDTAAFVFLNSFSGRCLSSASGLMEKIVPENVRSAWSNLQSSVRIVDTLPRSMEAPGYTDFAFYRRSLAWLELPAVARFRESVDPFFLDGREKSREVSRSEQTASDAYFETLKDAPSIALPAGTSAPPLERFDNISAGMFIRTAALVRLIKGGAEASSLSEQQLLTLVSATVDVPLLVTAGEIQQFFSSRRSTPVSDYIAAAMISDNTGRHADDHAFRKALQRLVMLQFGGDLVACVEFFRGVSNAVALHLFHKADTSFLNLLFDLYPKTDLVIEARARLFEWYAEKYEDPSALDRAKTLRVDQRLQQVRGEIDDLRIYADPLRFSQWMQDNTVEDLSSALRPGAITDAQIVAVRELGNFAEQREPASRLAAVFQRSFAEFCSSRRYGVDSYIGRRIRHGTLAGSMNSGLRELFDDEDYAPLFEVPGLKERLFEWRRNYEHHVDRLASDFFHIRSKQKPHGLIDVGVFSPLHVDILRQAMREVVSNASVNPSIAVSQQIIIEYCWRILEPDLKIIRAFVLESRAQWGMLDHNALHRLRPVELKSLLADFCRDVNLFTDGCFQAVAKWFTKPVTVTPTASFSLLFEAVLAEVKERFPYFDPRVTRTGSFENEIVGGAYHHIYDYFFIVIANAAEHGDPRGALLASVDVHKEDTIARIVISVTSDIKPDAEPAAVQREIELAQQGPLEDAMVVAGGSGLRKLQRLKLDSREIEEINIACHDRHVTVSCELRLAGAG